MKKENIKNIEMKRVNQYFSYGINKSNDLIVIDVVSKYFPLGIIMDLIKEVLLINNLVKEIKKEEVLTKVYELLLDIKNSSYNDKNIFIVTKSTAKVELVED